MMFGNGEPATRLRGVVSFDRSNAKQVDWTTPDELDLGLCGFDPGSSAEPVQQARNALSSQPVLYVDGDPDVTAVDRIRVRGRVYQVDGSPSTWRNPFSGWQPGTVIALIDVEG